MAGIKVLTPGISLSSRVERDIAEGSSIEEIKSSYLTDFCKDYRLFTYAPLLLYGGLQHNPVQEWINKYSKGPIVCILQLPKPVLITDLNRTKNKLDNIIWAVEKNNWPSLALHIGSIGLLNRPSKILTKVLHQEIPVIDTTRFDRTGVPEVVKISTFSVDSNRECLAFVPPVNNRIERPFLKRLPPLKETVALANAMFSESNNPYGDL